MANAMSFKVKEEPSLTFALFDEALGQVLHALALDDHEGGSGIPASAALPAVREAAAARRVAGSRAATARSAATSRTMERRAAARTRTTATERHSRVRLSLDRIKIKQVN